MPFLISLNNESPSVWLANLLKRTKADKEKPGASGKR